MAHLYHSCHKSLWSRFLQALSGRRREKMYRFRCRPRRGDELFHVQTFVCENCGDRIHVDTDWMDEDGGFIGKSVSASQLSSVAFTVEIPK